MKTFRILIVTLLAALPLFASAQEFLNIKELPERRIAVTLPPNKAEVVFIAATNDLVISSSHASVDKFGTPRKNSSGQYEYVVTLDLSEGRTMRHFTVEKKGTGFMARTKQKIIFQQGERHYIEVTEPEVKFTLNPLDPGTHLFQNEGCIEITSPLSGLVVDAPQELECIVDMTNNSAGSYVTSIKINTIKLESIKNAYKNQPELLEEKTTILIGFENSNIVSVNVQNLSQREKQKYAIVPIVSSPTAQDNSVNNDFQYVVFKVTPSNALVSLDGELLAVSGGMASKYVGAGTYSYKVECTLYHSKTGTVTMAGEKVIVEVELEPAFGYVNITGNTSKGGIVYIDKQNIGTAPIRSGQLPSGKHMVEIVKELYKPYRTEIVVEDGKTKELPVEMEANFAHVIFEAEMGVSIYINGKQEGMGRVAKDLAFGLYEVETQMPNCRSVKETYEITSSMMNKTISLATPIPIMGSVRIESTPSDATVLVDGEEKDKTPCAFSLIIGEHLITLKADGYAITNKKIVVEEGKVTEVDVKLDQRPTITIKSNPSAASIYINGQYQGMSPLEIHLAKGTYTVRAEYNGNSVSKDIEVPDIDIAQVFTINIGCNVRLESYPIHAKLFIDGSNAGYTPYESFLTFGSHKIKLKKKGMVKKETINVTSNKNLWSWDMSRLKYQYYHQYSPDVFFTLNLAYSFMPQWSFGFRIGAVEKWGWNISMMTNFKFKSYTASPMIAGEIYDFGEVSRTRLGVTVGAVWRPKRVALLFLNAGYGYRGVCYWAGRHDGVYDPLYYLYKPHTYHGAEVSAGLMLNLGGFVMSAEVGTINFKYWELKWGIGGLISR